MAQDGKRYPIFFPHITKQKSKPVYFWQIAMQEIRTQSSLEGEFRKAKQVVWHFNGDNEKHWAIPSPPSLWRRNDFQLNFKHTHRHRYRYKYMLRGDCCTISHAVCLGAPQLHYEEESFSHLWRRLALVTRYYEVDHQFYLKTGLEFPKSSLI